MASPKYSHHFSVNNLPYGVASSPTQPRQCATRLANTVIFLGALQQSGFFDKIDALSNDIFSSTTLNEFAALPKHTHTAVRAHLQSTLRDPGLDAIPANAKADITAVQVHLPVSIPGFTGKYALPIPLQANTNSCRLLQLPQPRPKCRPRNPQRPLAAPRLLPLPNRIYGAGIDGRCIWYPNHQTLRTLL